ncbi:GMC oxidoreductase-like protein [Podospora didyma]|uniref:GMC oxidoreductase-like protein n=1 Tax=Podospora didyma TaxID=330526 RepID=A0AAE0KD61_9PEZI|nr:GMC oxidoreductase-like protein [Podospora didyma]
MQRRMGFLGVFLLSLAAAVSGLPGHHASLKRQVSQLRPTYDFIIIGGGTSGLTVADRLSEAFPKKTVLVIEYGDVEYAYGSFDPPQLWLGPPPAQASAWTFFSQPNPDVNNKTAFVKVGQLVGGSSAVNGQFFDRGSRFDYDAWTEAGGHEFRSSDIKWDWHGLLPYFKKSVTFTKPSAELVQKYGYTWDIPAAYGGSTPIHSSFSPFQWADWVIQRDTWRDLGLPIPKECAGGDKQGICWVPTSQHPVTARRSHAGLGHYADVRRPNYDLLVKHQVIRVVYPKGSGKSSSPPLVEVRSLSNPAQPVFNVTAKAEVIISAGAFHTPTILQRSGIGPAASLAAAGIPTLIDLPGVGANLQDHSGPGVIWNCNPIIQLTTITDTKPRTFSPVPADLLNATYLAEATAQFNEVPARGPYTLALGNTAIYVSLPRAAPASFQTIVSKILELANGPLSNVAPFFPPNTDATILQGYKSQLSALATLLSNPQAPSLETPWATGSDPTAWSFLLHPLSRGFVRLNPTDPLSQPLLDYRMLSNPLDMDIHLAHLKFLRTLVSTPTMKKYGAVEVSPGAAVQTDAQLAEYVRAQMILSFQHPCCTAAMMPRSKGGVVGPDLKVHGVKGIRVADMSVMPLLPGSHLSATAYAVGEKAADIIIDEWKKSWH